MSISWEIPRLRFFFIHPVYSFTKQRKLIYEQDYNKILYLLSPCKPTKNLFETILVEALISRTLLKVPEELILHSWLQTALNAPKHRNYSFGHFDVILWVLKCINDKFE
jgi:hypothetical protein